MRIVICSVFILGSVMAATLPKKSDVATEVVRSEHHSRYVPVGKSEVELNKAALADAAVRLQEIMLDKGDERELQICYALRVLQSQIAVTQSRLARSGDPRGYSNTLAVLLRQQQDLIREFRGMQK